jgi:phage FluMu protein Com
MAKYRCKHCGKTVNRESKKAWIKSYCDTSDKYVHLIRVKPIRKGSTP